ncbi:unnamed protein product [Triticum turgidum subsp. durum]|uniref:CCHC-type domain-containing protein n=1 Tax=Triticum turgidum subsp. durum TaxID=4567 RepID=A0A9R0W891_TRITD|nr:unnamed protein product [Triticum turgidum subsp. durum]
MEEEFISLGDESCVAPTPKDKDGIIHLQVQQNQFQAVHLDIMDAPPQTQTQPQDNVDINANAASSCVPVEIPKGRSTESAVRLVYTNLTRESKRKLMELMQQWSHCQATRITNQPNSYSTVEDMDLSDGNNVLLVTKHGVSAEMGKGSGPEAALVHASRTSSALIDQSPTRGVKRARAESTEPSVRVVYNNLTRESKKKLMELMQQWSEWQARKQHASTETVEEVLDCGEETYYPALHVGSERSCAVSFWVDSQARGNAAVDDGAVPLYDREFTLGSTPMGDSSNAEGKKDKDDSRCFNCGSYSHALKDCPKPRDHVAISNARKQHNLKRNLSNVGNRGQNRYYQKTPGKFDDLKAGVLGSETRECLGLRENDPPPWLHRMRELGYPPGYLDEVEDEDKPSGITIFGDGEVKEEQQQQEEGELLEKGEASSPRKRMTVGFPGINAPVPENGDPWLWGSAPPPPLQSSSGRHNQHSSSDSRDRAPPAPPGVEHYSSSRYHSYDYGPAIPGAGRRSSSGYDDGAWTPSPSFSSRQHSGSGSGSRERERDWERDRERERERDRERDRHYYSSRR